MNLYEKIKESSYYDNDPRGLEYYPDEPQDSSEDDNYTFDKATELERLHQYDNLYKNQILSKVFSLYPDISEEDEDYLNGLSKEELIQEIKNRSWTDIFEEANATERLERRYGSVEDSELQEDDKSNWFRGALGLQDWVKEKCHFDCRVYMRDNDQEKLDKAWNLLWHIAQSYAKPLSKYDVHASVGNKDILLDIQNKGSGGLVYRITFPDPYNDVNAFKGVSAVVHGDQNFTADWYELTQALSHIIL